MVVTVSAKNYTLIDDCEALGSWTGETPAVVSDFFKEGANCLGFTVRGAGNNDTYRTGSWDLSGTKHFRWWFMTVALKELNWVQLYVSDGTDTGYYDVLAMADYPGGWYNIVIDLSRPVDAGVKPNMAAITTIGFRYNHTGVAKNAQNTWIDHLYIADGLIAYGDDAGQPFDFADILSADEDTTNGWGLIRAISGVYYLVGELTFGDDAGTNSCDFKDISQIGIFEDRKVNAQLYNLSLVGNGTGTTEVFWGNKTGGRGIQGCVFKSPGTAKYKIIATNSNITSMGFYGCSFVEASSIYLPAKSGSREVLSTSFEACGEVFADTCKVQYSKFINASGNALRISETGHQVTDCDFINNPFGVHVPVSGTYTFDNLKFTGNTYDILNSSPSGITINAVNGADPATASNSNGGTTTILNSVFLTVDCEDEDGIVASNARVAIFAASDMTQFMNELSDTAGRAQETYNYTGDKDIFVRIRKSSGGKEFYPYNTAGTITSDGYTLRAVLIEDTIAT